MFDAIGKEINFNKTYAFTQMIGGVRATFVGTFESINESKVKINQVSQVFIFDSYGNKIENQQWVLKPVPEIFSNALFPIDSLQLD